MNNSSCSSVDEPPDVAGLRHLTYAIIMPVILAFGMLFNTFSLVAAARSNLNSIALSYLFAIILSNLSLMILAVPWLMHRVSQSDQCYSHATAFYHANIEPILLNWLATFSTYVLLCMSIERFVSVIQPSLFHRIHVLSRAVLALATSLCMCLIFHLPTYLKWSITCPDCWSVTIEKDVTSTTLWWIYIYTSQTMARFAPCAALVLLNIITIFKYRRIINKRSRMTTNAVSASQTNTPSNSTNNLSIVKKKIVLSASSQDEKRQLKLLSGLVCLVAVCIVPAGVAALLPHPDGNEHYVFGFVVEALELFHHSVISLVICMCNNDIHRRVRKMITCNSVSF